MIKNPRNLLWILPLLIFLTSPLWQPPVARFLTPRGGYNPKLAEIEEQTPVQNFSMDQVSITLTSDGTEEWQVDADRAYTGTDDHVIEMEGVNAMYIGTEKDPTNITSLRGRYRIDERHLTLIDKVVINKPTKGEIEQHARTGQPSARQQLQQICDACARDCRSFSEYPERSLIHI